MTWPLIGKYEYVNNVEYFFSNSKHLCLYTAQIIGSIYKNLK